jgi:diguanylate cyclase (GGDEF)-like protein
MATAAGSNYNVSLLEFRIGTLDLDEGRPQQAKESFQRALPEFIKRDSEQLFATLTQLKLAKAEALMKQHDQAFAALAEGCSHALAFGWPRIVGECYSTTADVNVEFGDFRQANKASQQLIALEREVRQRAQMAELEELKVRFDNRIANAENALLKSREAESENRRTALVLALALALVVLGCAIAFLWNATRQKRRFAMLALLDELTGAPNRRSMHDLLQREFASRRTSSAAFWIGILDIDHFKSINDTLGHDVGDEVLREIYRSCQLVLRRSDVLGRWGGEEFLLVMRDIDATAVQVLFDRLLEAVRETREITFSMGACEATAEVADAEELLKLADDALYRAKAMGRSRCVIADSRRQRRATGESMQNVIDFQSAAMTALR